MGTVVGTACAVLIAGLGVVPLSSVAFAAEDVPTPLVCTSPTTLPTSTDADPLGWGDLLNAQYVPGGIQLTATPTQQAWAYLDFDTPILLSQIGDLTTHYSNLTGTYGIILQGQNPSQVNVHFDNGEFWQIYSGVFPETSPGYYSAPDLNNLVSDPLIVEIAVWVNPESSMLLHSQAYGCNIQPFSAAPTFTPVCTQATGSAFLPGDGVIAVPGNWEEKWIDVPFTGTLADIGTGLDINATPLQYVGLHIVTAEGTIVFEKEASYSGNLWSKTAWAGVPAGMGYAAFGSITDFVKYNGDVQVTGIRLLYTSPEASSTTVASFTIGCTTYTFVPQPEALPGTDKTDSTPVCHDPKDGKADYTHTETPWTQPYVWDADASKWALGDKVPGEPVVTTVTVDSAGCAAVVPTPTPTTTPSAGSTPPPDAGHADLLGTTTDALLDTLRQLDVQALSPEAAGLTISDASGTVTGPLDARTRYDVVVPWSAADTWVDVYLYSSRVYVGTYPLVDGTVRLAGLDLSTLSAGTHHLVLVGQQTGTVGAVQLQVTTASGALANTGNGSLAATGANPAALGLLAILVAIAGGALTLVRHRALANGTTTPALSGRRHRP